MTTSNEHNNAPAVPQGWRISKTRLDGREATIVNGPGGGCVACKDADIPRVVPESILYDLATTLLTATPATAPAQDAKVMPQLHRAVAKAQQIQPVLVLAVEKEPDYWSGGHFHEGTKSCIDPTKVWALPIGTKLYADSNHTPPVPCSGESYAG